MNDSSRVKRVKSVCVRVGEDASPPLDESIANLLVDSKPVGKTPPSLVYPNTTHCTTIILKDAIVIEIQSTVSFAL